MKLQNYIKNRKLATTISEIISLDIEGLSVMYMNYKDILEDIETAVFVQACESCAYDSNELATFKAGLMTIRKLLEEAHEDWKLSVDKEEAEKPKSKPTY